VGGLRHRADPADRDAAHRAVVPDGAVRAPVRMDFFNPLEAAIPSCSNTCFGSTHTRQFTSLS
jgi:hypothetical protein